ncbi:MAG: hypothetical protein HKM04_02035 [Legionellales bacterium]|nr:hypothetical protein [Legionellales bacterium]
MGIKEQKIDDIITPKEITIAEPQYILVKTELAELINDPQEFETINELLKKYHLRSIYPQKVQITPLHKALLNKEASLTEIRQYVRNGGDIVQEMGNINNIELAETMGYHTIGLYLQYHIKYANLQKRLIPPEQENFSSDYDFYVAFSDFYEWMSKNLEESEECAVIRFCAMRSSYNAPDAYLESRLLAFEKLDRLATQLLDYITKEKDKSKEQQINLCIKKACELFIDSAAVSDISLNAGLDYLMQETKKWNRDIFSRNKKENKIASRVDHAQKPNPVPVEGLSMRDKKPLKQKRLSSHDNNSKVSFKLLDEIPVNKKAKIMTINPGLKNLIKDKGKLKQLKKLLEEKEHEYPKVVLIRPWQKELLKKEASLEKIRTFIEKGGDISQPMCGINNIDLANLMGHKIIALFLQYYSIYAQENIKLNNVNCQIKASDAIYENASSSHSELDDLEFENFMQKREKTDQHELSQLRLEAMYSSYTCSSTFLAARLLAFEKLESLVEPLLKFNSERKGILSPYLIEAYKLFIQSANNNDISLNAGSESLRFAILLAKTEPTINAPIKPKKNLFGFFSLNNTIFTKNHKINAQNGSKQKEKSTDNITIIEQEEQKPCNIINI